MIGYSSNTGLGYQTRDFYKNIGADKVLIANLEKFNGMPVDHSWAYQPRVCNGIPTRADIEWVVDGMDVVFCCETPLNFYLFEYAKKQGVKTVMQYNFEFLRYIREPKLIAPDVLASPSFWKIPEVEKLGIAEVVYLPVPIDIKRIPYRVAPKVETLVHVMGRAAMNDRNGTKEFLKLALDSRMKDYKFLMYAQKPTERSTQQEFDSIMRVFHLMKSKLRNRIEIRYDVKSNADLYAEGEVMVMPRKYAGLCLPLWEALSSGMPVVMTDISPNNKVLPKQWLCDTHFSGDSGLSNGIDMFSADIDSLVETVKWISNNYEISNVKARSMAESMSWDARRDSYIKLFERICG